jgi:hypothetical protein
MKAIYVSQYTKANGNTVNRYKVTGSAAELKAYEAAQGDNFRKDSKTGDPIFFSTNYVGEQVNLIITEKGKVVADMSEFRKAESLVKQFGGNFGQALAQAQVAKLMGTGASSIEAPAVSAPASAEGLNKM